jgi:hypothetical protein
MGALVQRIIRELNNAKGVDDFGDCIWMASDLIRRASSQGYLSGFEAIDREDLSEAEGKEIQDAAPPCPAKKHKPQMGGRDSLSP